MLLVFPTDDDGQILVDPTRVVGVYQVPSGAALVVAVGDQSHTMLTTLTVDEVRDLLLNSGQQSVKSGKEFL